jgi:two-component system chemotaxis sensor kinase CheA
VINVILAGGDTLKQFVSHIAARLAGPNTAGPVIVPTSRLFYSIKAILSQQTGPAAHLNLPDNSSVKREREECSTPAAGATPASAVKVDTIKLDSLIDLVGEMVIAQSLVVQNEELVGIQSEKLVRDLSQLSRISKDLQRSAMALRMVPIRATFQKMNRLVRDLSVKLGKQVELVTEGEDTELDRTIVEEISDPLVHMIRNSVDHGIEMPEDRIKKGKPAKGTISLKAFHRGGNIVIEIRDDGAGLNKERICAKALEQGLIGKDESLSENEIFKLIMRPGFSTAEKVTDVSGRGVGMDVVRGNIDRLRGKIDIQSTSGQGSCFSIYLPLTLAIIDGLLVGIGNHRYILPTLSVCESFQPTAGMIQTVQGRGETVSVRGRLRPLLRLSEHLGIAPSSTDPTHSIVVVVESGSDARCILVDQLLGKQEVVIKSMGETFRASQCVAGAAILGDGRIGLILDPQALVHLASNSLKEAA